MWRSLVLASAGSIGCSYPSFGFTGSDSALVEPETSVVDSGASIDTAAVDTAIVADSSIADTFMPSGCASVTAKHCFDWDSVATPGEGWTYFAADPPGTIALDTTGAHSGPNAFLATTSPGTGSVVVANLIQTLTTAADDTVVKLDGWLKLESATFPGTGGAFLFKIQQNTGGGDGVTFSLGSMGFYVDRIALSYEYYAITAVPKIATWMHVRMHAKLHTTNGSINLWIDDMATPALSVTGVSTAKADSTAKEVVVGLYAQDSTGTMRARYDDVAIDY